MQEECGVCGTTVPFSVTTHVMLNPAVEEGVRDFYVCSDCFEAHLEGLFPRDDEEERAE